jgi:hypothetical protein
MFLLSLGLFSKDVFIGGERGGGEEEKMCMARNY